MASREPPKKAQSFAYWTISCILPSTTPAYQHTSTQHPLGPRPSTQNVARSHTDSLTLMRAHACTHTHAHARVRLHKHAARPMHARTHAQVPHTSMSRTSRGR
jgi:hypothetical protein